MPQPEVASLPEMPSRAGILAALETCDDYTFLLIASVMRGLLLTTALRDEGDDLALLDATLAYLDR